MKYLIEECHSDSMCFDSNSRVPLHFAASNGHYFIAKYLIEVHGCDPMCRSKKGCTPIHLASQKGHYDIVKYLIEKCQCDCMSLQCDEQFQWVPLHFAASNGHLSIVKYLIEEHGCDPMCHSKRGSLPLHLASEKGHFDIVKYLIKECQCDPMSLQCDEQFQWAPIHFATSNGHLLIAKYLVEEHGCDPMCRMKIGLTPLHLSSENGHFDIVKYLIEEQGCDPMCQFKLGITALHYATENHHEKVVNYLLMKGANPNILVSSFLHFAETYYPFLSCYHADSSLVKTKVFVIGSQGAGKSSLVESLKQEERWLIGRFTNVQGSSETTGIISHHCTSQYFGDIMLYDFAGHPVYYASHPLLIQNATNSVQVPVFILVLDLRLSSEDFSKQLKYWVSFLTCICSVKIVLVIAGSHSDSVSNLDLQAKKAVIVKFKGTLSRAKLSLKFVPLDCRKAKSTGIDQIRDIISHLCKEMNGRSALCTFHYMLLAFFKWSFGNAVAFQLLDTIEILRRTNIPLPCIDEDYICSLCEDLCAVACIVFLKNSTLSKCWIALDQSKVISEIQRFRQDQEFVSTIKSVSTGIVPYSLLLANFSARNEVTLDFILRYMLEMEYCQLIDDDVLSQRLSDEPHYFFSDHVLGASPLHLWSSDIKYKKYFGWLLKSKDNFFFPKFVQVLLLRLATQHDLFDIQDPMNDDHLPQLRPGTKIWKSGISWINHEYEIIIEVNEHNTGIIIMSRCSDNYEVNHYRIRSAVIKTVLKVKQDICPQLEAEEYIINPEQMHEYPLSRSALQVVTMRELVHCCSHHESDMVVLYNMEAQHDSHFHIQLTVANLIGFDPILVLGKASLTDLFDERDHEMSCNTLRIIADDFSEHLEPICEVLGLQSNEFLMRLKDNPLDSTDKVLSAIYEAFRVTAHDSVTNKWLREKLEKYSIICGRYPFVSDPIYDSNIVNWPKLLHVAAKQGHLDMVRYLVEEGNFDSSCVDDVGRTPLYLAVWNGWIHVVNYFMSLADNGLSMITTKEDMNDGVIVAAGKTPLHAACLRGHLNIVQCLVELYKCDIECDDSNGTLPLHCASAGGYQHIVEYLCQHKNTDAMCSQKNESQLNSLHFAADNGHLLMTKYLIEVQGCDPMCQTKERYVPLHFATSKGHYDVVKYLIEVKKCSVIVQTKEGLMPLHLAAQNGHLDLVKYFIDGHQCEPMLKQCNEKFQWTPLHFAASEGHISTMMYLIKKTWLRSNVLHTQ